MSKIFVLLISLSFAGLGLAACGIGSSSQSVRPQGIDGNRSAANNPSLSALGVPVSKQSTFELVSIEDQAKDAVKSADTEFRVSIAEQEAAWDRAMLFFNQYVIQFKPGAESLPGSGNKLSNVSSKTDQYHYSVERYVNNFGSVFLVSCRPNRSLVGLDRSSRQLAQRNAQNLARFIKEGQLELSLLAR